MKPVSQLAKKVAVSPAQYCEEPKQRRALIDPESAQIVNLLFAELKAVHPAWRLAWPDVDTEKSAKRSWTKALTAAGLQSIEQIRYGIERCRASGTPFMPSAGQFLEWCKPTPENMGLPSADRAYLQACSASHPAADASRLHPAVWHAACEAGLYVLARQPESKSRPVFLRAYAMTLEMIVRGESLRPMPAPPERQLPKLVNLDAGRAALAGLKRQVRGVAL